MAYMSCPQILSFRNVPSLVCTWHVAAIATCWAHARACWPLRTEPVSPHPALPSYIRSQSDPDTFHLCPGLGTTYWKGSALFCFEKKPTMVPLFASFHPKTSTAPLLRVCLSIIFVMGGLWCSSVHKQERLVHHLAPPKQSNPFRS